MCRFQPCSRLRPRSWTRQAFRNHATQLNAWLTKPFKALQALAAWPQSVVLLKHQRPRLPAKWAVCLRHSQSPKWLGVQDRELQAKPCAKLAALQPVKLRPVFWAALQEVQRHPAQWLQQEFRQQHQRCNQSLKKLPAVACPS